MASNAEEPVCSRFTYSKQDYTANVSWHSFTRHRILSKFDVAVCKAWDSALKAGHFRYSLTDVKCRTVPGQCQYVLQLNMKRGTERRRPEDIHNLQMPFNPERFNFTRVPQHEIMFLMDPSDDNVGVSNGYQIHNEKSECVRHLVLINVSPLEYGHILLVPDVDSCTPQKLTQRALKLSLDLLLLSSHPGWRVGFNSLCALASVNHQHVHAWYLDQPMAIERARASQICDHFYELVYFPTRCFAFQLHGTTVEHLSRVIFLAADYLQRNDIAHNFFMTRGALFTDVACHTCSDDADHDITTLRAFLWPRTSVTGVKNEKVNEVIFNVAVAELAGHIPMYMPEKYESLTEDDINRRLAEHMVTAETFNRIRDDIRQLLLSNAGKCC